VYADHSTQLLAILSDNEANAQTRFSQPNGATHGHTGIDRIQGFVEDFAGGETKLGEIRHVSFLECAD
jgi:hypothetical protein